VPFFFEPNFDAVIKPLESCLERDHGEKKVVEQVVYGEYLVNKVAGNFYLGPAPS
jgi:isopenicillin N synthase-like dioxygenase